MHIQMHKTIHVHALAPLLVCLILFKNFDLLLFFDPLFISPFGISFMSLFHSLPIHIFFNHIFVLKLLPLWHQWQQRMLLIRIRMESWNRNGKQKPRGRTMTYWTILMSIESSSRFVIVLVYWAYDLLCMIIFVFGDLYHNANTGSNMCVNC